MKCRHCRRALDFQVIDLGRAPASNAYVTQEAAGRLDRTYPLRVLVCERCWLVQTEDFADARDLFTDDYAYFSSTSSSWTAHAERFVSEMVSRFSLGPHSRVIEVAANDGYLLQFVQARGIPCLGIEPTASTGAVARTRGIHIMQEFFGSALAERLSRLELSADLMVANNVLAHVPDINDFVAGFARLLKPTGVATFEFPHLLRLMSEGQFDTIYHEHFSYLSLSAADRIFQHHGLEIFDVEPLQTHGGSLRIFAQRSDSRPHAVNSKVADLLRTECQAGILTTRYYSTLQARAERTRVDLLRFLRNAKSDGLFVAAYGAAAKGNTLLNFAGVSTDLIRYVVDRSLSKQGKYMPGSRLPIVGPGELLRDRPDYLLVLPWNIIDEIRAQNAHLAASGTKFVTAIPELKIQ